MDDEVLDKAFDFAKRKHGEQMYGAFPYTYHLLDVLDKVEEMGLPLEYQVVALLHDTIEDTNTTEEELVELFGYNIAVAVYYMSKEKESKYEKSIFQG